MSGIAVSLPSPLSIMVKAKTRQCPVGLMTILAVLGQSVGTGRLGSLPNEFSFSFRQSKRGALLPLDTDTALLSFTFRSPKRWRQLQLWWLLSSRLPGRFGARDLRRRGQARPQLSDRLACLPSLDREPCWQTRCASSTQG